MRDSNSAPTKVEMVRVCRLSELSDGEGKSFVAATSGTPRYILLARKGNAAFAYRDRCPHMGTSLMWGLKVLVSSDGHNLRCANHNALFRIEDGQCVAGPCVGEWLEPETVRLLDGYLWLELASDGSRRWA